VVTSSNAWKKRVARTTAFVVRGFSDACSPGPVKENRGPQKRRSALPAPVVKELKEETAKRILKTLRENLHYPWCREMLARLRLPPSVHDESHFRLWNRRFHPFNVYTEEKRREKLNYMHNNPVKRGLVSSPGDWPWSSWWYYFLHDASLLRMDRLD
jgi:hypothetical protein